MKVRILFIIVAFFSLLAMDYNPLSAQCNGDKDVLVELYNANPQSQGILGWDLGAPINTWNGITEGGGCVTRIEITDAGLSVIPESIGNLSRLNYLDLKRNSISSLPDGIGMLDQLQVLELAENNIGEIPESIRDLVRLIRIDLNSNVLDTLPEAIENLVNLKFFYMNDNRLRFLIPEIGDLSRLEELEVNRNELEVLPPEIGNLPELMHLHLAENRITGIPVTIGNLDRLLILDLQTNFIAEIPASFGNLENLTSFDISGNELTELPASIGNLSNLEVLNLYRNDIVVFPDTISSLSSLKVLNFGGNKILSIPDNVGDLSRLEELYVHNNNLTEVPSTIGDLVFLKRLWVNNNYLTELPESFGQLIRLDYLFAFNNSLAAIPESLGNLTTLNFLYLQNNRLTALPESFGNMVNLQYLRLENNDLKELPSTFGDLESLIELDLRNNKIKDLPPPVGQLADMKDIDVVDNALSFEDLDNIRNFIDRADVKVAYAPQDTFSQDTLFYFKKGVMGVVDLGYDAGIDNSVYRWFKNEQIYTPGPGNDININKLVFEDPSLDDIGTYRAVSTNPDFPSLTVESANISVKVCDRRNDSLELVKLYQALDGQNWRNNTNWRVMGMPIDTWAGVTVDAFGCVSKIDLAGNMLTGSVPNLEMNTLDTLILADNDITGVNDRISVPYIRYVDLSNNKITTFPGVILKWMSLQNLILSNAFDFNGFQPLAEGIPPEIGDLCDLTELEVDGNGFEGEVPAELTMLNNLEKGDVTFANNMLDSVRREFIYFCPFGVEILAGNDEGAFEKFVKICGDTCGGLEFEQLIDLPWLIDSIQRLDCTGEACFDNNVRSDAGFVVARDLKIVYTRTRCFSGEETYDEVIRLYDCGGNLLEDIGCDSDRSCSGLGVLNESDFGGLEFDSKWSCGCDFTACIERDTIVIDQGETDTLNAPDFIIADEVCNPGFYSISSVNNELPGMPPIVTEDNIGFTYELVSENLISGQQCTTTIEVVRGATGRNEYEKEDPEGPVLIACHPNPVVDFLRCPEIDMVNVEEYRVYSVQGQEMPKYVENYKDKLQLNVGSYPTGMYILLVKTKERQYLNRFTVIR